MADRIIEREPSLGKVEVSDAQRAAIRVTLQLGDEAGEVDVALGGLGDAPARLAKLDVAGVGDQLGGVLAPAGDMAGVEQQPGLRHLAEEGDDAFDAVRDRTAPRLDPPTRRAAEGANGDSPLARPGFWGPPRPTGAGPAAPQPTSP